MNAVVYIASLWLKPKLTIVLNSAGHTGSSGNKLTQNLSTGGRSTARCDATSGGRDVEWFFNNIATDLILPSMDAVKFGMLRVSTGRCARLLKATGRIALQDCLRNLYVRPPKEMTFELLREGQLKVTGESTFSLLGSYTLHLLKNCVLTLNLVELSFNKKNLAVANKSRSAS